MGNEFESRFALPIVFGEIGNTQKKLEDYNQ